MYASLAMARASAALTLVWASAGAKRSAGTRAMPPAKDLRVMDFMVLDLILAMASVMKSLSEGSPKRYATFFNGGFCHLPSNALVFGQYRRKYIRNGPCGAGSQLASLSLPGLSLWISNVRPPSASRLNCGIIGELSR